MLRTLLPPFCVILCFTSIRAQCLIGNDNAPQSDPTNVEIGQSFMALCDGIVEYVEIQCAVGGTNVAGQLKIYAGSTVTSTPVHTQAVPATALNDAEYLRIYLSAPVAATSFSQLTFELPMSLEIPFSGGNPYPGGRMFYNGTNAALYANSDIRFNVSILSDCTTSYSFLDASACQSFLSPSGQQWTSSGVYTDTIPNAAGCDSIITVDLDVIDLDTTLTVDGMLLTANATDASYQWIDCGTGQPIIGANMQSHLADAAGTYAVVVSAGGCSEQSACIFVSSTSLAHGGTSPLLLSTGTGSGTLSIGGIPADEVVRVLDAQGRTVHQARGLGAGRMITCAGLAPGTYLVVLNIAPAQRVVVW